VLGVPEWAVRVGLAAAQVLEVVDRPSRCRPVGRAAPLRRGAARVGLAVLAVAPPGGRGGGSGCQRVAEAASASQGIIWRSSVIYRRGQPPELETAVVGVSSIYKAVTVVVQSAMSWPRAKAPRRLGSARSSIFVGGQIPAKS
jgi:hypothetical protein